MQRSPIGNGDEAPIEYKVYTQRWWMLLVFSLNTMANAVIWISFAPIAGMTGKYYLGADAGASDHMVNLLSLSYMILYFPGTILANFLMESHGLRRCVVTGALLNLVSVAVRFASAYTLPAGYCLSFTVLIVGQSIGGIAQPLFTNAPAKLAGVWFGRKERDVATVIAALSNSFGNAIGQVLPTLLVNQDKETGQVTGMKALLAVELGFIGALAVICWLVFQARPPTPPSRSESMRGLMRQASRTNSRFRLEDGAAAAAASRPKEHRDSVGSRVRGILANMWEDLRELLRDPNFLVLMTGFGVGLGLFNALLTCIEQVVTPCGYTSDDAGVFGGALIGAGTVGAAMAGTLLDATHAYRTVLKVGFMLTTVAVLAFVYNLRPGQPGVVTGMFATMGFFMMPLYPVTLEAAVECTYPISEEASGGVLLLVGQWSGMAFTFAMTALIQMRETYTNVYTPVSCFLTSVCLACSLIILLFRGPYKRQAHERRKSDGLSPASGPASPQPLDAAMMHHAPAIRSSPGTNPSLISPLMTGQ